MTPLIEAAPPTMSEYGVSLEDFAQDMGGGRRDERRDRVLDFDIALVALMPKCADIRQHAQARQLLSESSSRALDKLQMGRLTLTRAEKNAFKTLVDRLEITY